MQLIAEAYDVLKSVGKLSNDELHNAFSEWNKGELLSFLIEITADIFTIKDDQGDGYLVDKVLDKTGMKGTGKWTVQQAAELSVAAPTIESSLDARFLSGLKEERVEAAKTFKAGVFSSVLLVQVCSSNASYYYNQKLSKLAAFPAGHADKFLIDRETKQRGASVLCFDEVQATFECLLKAYGFRTPDFWIETRFFKAPFQEYTDYLSKPTKLLGDNQLTGTIPPTLGQVKTLSVLRLNNNLLTGPAPSLNYHTQMNEL
ncbi:hypothetical protein H6P81_006581 [Aristolochia fimbriata]|uniref:phosphogluconate dehydrogenase (NADP(+)-dependent, decarboxylating) n=1 Tax=Aristolochia fimbriata TaxID=158543 RepID=A0AAV7F1K7_ARIFI|nr:hypothetical protein H6P81_006581 [Aristolochia fimbriata]